MSEYNEQRAAFDKAVKTFDGNNSFAAARALLLSGEKTVSFNRKIIEKNIDSSWLTEIEKALPHLDTVIRNPRNTIKEVEEIVPIAMSRKITVESIKHLGQHTDLIQDIDKKTGKITPSKILNIHKEETLDTYENRFVNTLIDRLYIFINIRYNKLVQTAEAQEAYSFNYDTVADSGDGRKVNISFKIETVDSLVGGSKDTDVWARLERVKKAIEGYKGSVLCTTLGNAFIRPPVMRTNAITKNVDLMACLTLWQFIESYDKAGYEVNVSDIALHELAVSSSLRTVCTPYISHLKCFERGRKLVCVVGIVTAERNGQVITQAAVYEIVFFLSGLEFQLLSSF